MIDALKRNCDTAQVSVQVGLVRKSTEHGVKEDVGLKITQIDTEPLDGVPGLCLSVAVNGQPRDADFGVAWTTANSRGVSAPWKHSGSLHLNDGDTYAISIGQRVVKSGVFVRPPPREK